jgi:hypothetical protein
MWDAEVIYTFSQLWFTASQSSEVGWKETPDWKIMALSGLTIDTIDTVGPATQESGESGATDTRVVKATLIGSFDLLKESRDKVEKKYGESFIKVFVSTLSLGSTMGEDGFPCPTSEESILQDFVSYIHNFTFIAWDEAGESGFECQRSILELAEHALKAITALDSSRVKDDWSQASREWVENAINSFHPDDPESAAKANKIIGRLLEVRDKEGIVRFQSQFELYALGRKLFITQLGNIGIGPACMAPGDIVCLLFGGSSLYVIRRISLQEYLFLGECYVHGLMNGEAMDRYQKGEVSAEWFYLR